MTTRFCGYSLNDSCPYHQTINNTAHRPRKTKPKGRHPDKALSASFVRSAPPGRHADGNGLYLFVQPTGTRNWIQRLVVRDRKRELGLGSVAPVSLAEARQNALANRKLAREGGDPLAEKRRALGIPSFAEAAARVVEQQRAGWRDPNYPKVWLRNPERRNLCATSARIIACNCERDGGRSFGVGMQVQASNHPKRLWSKKTTVVSVGGKAHVMRQALRHLSTVRPKWKRAPGSPVYVKLLLSG